MTTARDMITRSLRAIGVLHSTETPSADEALDGLSALNDMLNSWIYTGIDLEHATIESLNDVLPYPDDHMGPIRWNLAVRLAPDYGVELTAAVVALAKEGFDQMLRAYMRNDELSFDGALSSVFAANRGRI